MEFGGSNAQDEAMVEKFQKRPIATVDKFHSQFQIAIGSYRDINNFIQHNKISSSTGRWLFNKEYRMF